MSQAFHAQGSTLKISDMDEAEPTFTAVAELTDISGPSLSTDTIDVTNHDSEEAYREFVAGLKDAGEVNIEGNFLASHETLESASDVFALFDSGDLTDFEIEFPDDDTTTWSFSGIVTAFETIANFEDAATFTATIKISGQPTLE